MPGYANSTPQSNCAHVTAPHHTTPHHTTPHHTTPHRTTRTAPQTGNNREGRPALPSWKKKKMPPPAGGACDKRCPSVQVDSGLDPYAALLVCSHPRPGPCPVGFMPCLKAYWCTRYQHTGVPIFFGQNEKKPVVPAGEQMVDHASCAATCCAIYAPPCFSTHGEAVAQGARPASLLLNIKDGLHSTTPSPPTLHTRRGCHRGHHIRLLCCHGQGRPAEVGQGLCARAQEAGPPRRGDDRDGGEGGGGVTTAAGAAAAAAAGGVRLCCNCTGLSSCGSPHVAKSWRQSLLHHHCTPLAEARDGGWGQGGTEEGKAGGGARVGQAQGSSAA